MKILRICTTALLLILTLASCEEGEKRLYSINIDKQVSCLYTEHSFDVEYTISALQPDIAEDSFTISVDTDTEWITGISSTEQGVLSISVAENAGALRSGTITITSPNIVSTKVEVTQIAAPQAEVKHTIIHYFFGTSLSRYFKTNREDAAESIASGILGSDNRYVYLMQNSASEAYIAEMCYDPVNGEVLERHVADIILDAGKPLSELIADNMAMLRMAAPAQSYGLILAGHGQGWVTKDDINSDSPIEFSAGGNSNPWYPALGAETTRAFGENNVQCDISELAEGLMPTDGNSYEYLLFDACFMANVEALYDLRNIAEYIIASPCEIMGRGFPYHRTLPHLVEGQRDLDAAARSYYTYYRDDYTGNARCGSIALIDCSELEPLAEATRQVAATMVEEYDRSTLQTYEGQSQHSFYDFGEWATTVATDHMALKAFDEQLSLTVTAKYTLPSFYSALGTAGTYPIDESIYSGITTSAPSTLYETSWRNTSWYKRVWM